MIKKKEGGLDLRTLSWTIKMVNLAPPLSSGQSVKDWLREAVTKAYKATTGIDLPIGELSDGYHTFNELYEFRKVFNAILFNEWARQKKYQVHKSRKHSDGEKCFGGGWFIVMATLPTGQISNHYEEKDWELFKCEERELADKWDGHTANDVIKRLKSLNKEK